jgi:DNA-binding Lrp family transcriptional regulator
MLNKRIGDLHLDGTDLRILAELVENSKSSYVEIGRRLGLHPNVVAYRVNRMEESGIIREYTAHVDYSKLGLSEQVFVAANFPNSSPREDMLKQISDIPGTMSIVSSLGSPEGLVFIVAKNKEDVNIVLSKLRSLNMDIEFTSSVIKTYDEGRLGTFLRTMATAIPAEGS